MLLWIKFIFTRSIWIYVAVAVIFAWTINFEQAFEERNKDLLGIFYNGYFQNYKDGIVYFDYMRRHEPNNADHYLKLAICYEKLGNKIQAAKFYEQARLRGTTIPTSP